MPELIKCERCGRKLSGKAAKRISGAICCPPCVAELKAETKKKSDEQWERMYAAAREEPHVDPAEPQQCLCCEKSFPNSEMRHSDLFQGLICVDCGRREAKGWDKNWQILPVIILIAGAFAFYAARMLVRWLLSGS